ncbi:MAG: response regulator [Anaerolineae bacterium]|nr:response regulator [Anaerolineae bacterium]
MKILVVEDEQVIREEVVTWLSFEGYDVISACDGREGLQIASVHQPDLVVSDITMPELDGYGLLLELQKQIHTKSIPFIFLTARSDKSFVRHGMELGADDYVTKPFTRGDLLSAINARLSRHRDIAAGVRQEVEELKGKIARLVSDNLKTPLTSMVFVQQLIERQLGQLDERELADLLQTMRASTDRMQHLVNQVVYLTQMNSGVLTADSLGTIGTSIYLWQIVPSAIDLARRYAYRNQNGYIAYDQRDGRSSIWGSSALLVHALAELLTHALNDAAEDGSIVVSQWHTDGIIWLTILEQGNGAEPNELSDPKRAIDEASQLPGLGTGLEAARRIIEIHGGTFEMRVVAGKGTQVTLGLPVHTFSDET